MGVENTLPEVDESALAEADENTPPEGLLPRPPFRELFPPHHDPIHHQPSSRILPSYTFRPPNKLPNKARARLKRLRPRTFRGRYIDEEE